MLLIGLDIGTTGCKAALFDETGTLVASASREYVVDFPQPGWAEQDAEAVWQLAQETLRAITATPHGPDAAAIGLSVQGEAIIPVNNVGQALRPAILGMDTRTGPQNQWLRERFGAEWLFEHTGMPVHTINTLPKLLWLRENAPNIWSSAAQFLLYEDFLISKMTGQAVTSRCLASRTQLYDLGAGQWSVPVLDALALDPARLATVQPSGYAVAAMHADLARELGFRSPPQIITGGHDQACGALGVGLVEPGLAMVSTGTAEVVEVALAQPALNPTLYAGNISVYAHVVPELYLAMTLNHSGGLLLRWFRDTMCTEELQQARADGQDAYDLILAGATPDPSGLLVLPHFAGSGTPTFDTASKGAILGLTFGTTRRDLAKALLEGLTYELRLNLDLLREGGVEIDQLRAIGGGARSDLWVQLKADITGIPVAVPRITEAACWGAALLAGAGAGCFTDVRAAAEAAVQFGQHISPDPTRHARYTDQYALYRQLYPAVKDIHHQL
ncbi:MAG: hypothetical protein GYB65_22195 [Chloroflexi bacterium]|nr:hypothetical protein [Chloroflexota bacterium]